MGFWIALQFLTIIPSPFWRKTGLGQTGKALIYFPAIGLLAGGLLFLADYGLNLLLSPAVSSALTLSLWIALSGAMHLDGLADTCDGLAGTTPADRLRIMADSHTGVYGVIGILIVLLLKYAAIVSIPGTWLLRAWLITPVLGYWAMVLALFAFPYAHKSGGMGQYLKESATPGRFIIVTLLTLAFVTVLGGWSGIIMMAATCLLTLITGKFNNNRLGGLTGDVYGTIKEVAEIMILILLPLIAGII
jgi:adenosylcobinamide-GDP ribazoletransferase